jgi:hypothetical protein
VYADASLLKIREWQGVYSPKDLQDATRDEMEARFLALDNLGFAFNPHFSNLCPYARNQITSKKAGESLSETEMKKRFMSYLGIESILHVKVKKSFDDTSPKHRNKRPRTSTFALEDTAILDTSLDSIDCDEVTSKNLASINEKK